ncbi:MAG: right-handed parallel beta-helix repeat-containing protein, partial [Cytophagales bacterium]|nr:right-handed parallel beta-helix repeat-containing protein [Cytophagales bacterium]
VKLFKDVDAAECAVAWKRLRTEWEKQGLGRVNAAYERVPDLRLTVGFTEAEPGEDLCAPAVAGGYLGAENQAIRVQITGQNKFTWGFDNAAPLYRVELSADGKTVKMVTRPRDAYHWPRTGQVIEILPWSAALPALPTTPPESEKVAELSGFLAKVDASFNPDAGTFTLATAVPAGFGARWADRSDKANLERPAVFYYLRVWNRGGDLASPVELPYAAGNAVALGNTGINVSFSGNDWATGDFWVIAARPETPDRVVPWELKTGLPPHGVRRFFAPLAIIRWRLFNGAPAGEVIHDCRKKFRPLTEQECCCTFTVGDGVSSKGDFDSLQEAVDNLPEEGGKICLLPGIHDANMVIDRRRQITLSGCGELSLVRPRQDRGKDPIIRIMHSQKICMEQISFFTADGIAIAVEDKDREAAASEHITIRHNQVLAGIHAVSVRLLAEKAGNNNIRIQYNKIGMFDKEEGLAALFSLADGVLIERNRLVMIPPPANDPDDPRGNNPPGDVYDPCRKLEKLYENRRRFLFLFRTSLKYLIAYVPAGNPIGYKAPGGIQIGCASDGVAILQNEIIGGRGNGILLGDFGNASQENFYFPAIRQVRIEDNGIQQMGGSGIGVLLVPGDRERERLAQIHVNDLTIYRNRIEACALQIPPQNDFTGVAFGGIVLAFCERALINGNRIENNGRSFFEPVCGIFVLHGERLDISGNQVLNNGPRTRNADQQVRRGRRGGIVVAMASQSLRSSFDKGVNAAGAVAGLPAVHAEPAIKLHDNVVTQPLGNAVLLVAFGPVSVVSNQFTSQGIDRLSVYSLLAGTVLIFNLGISKDLLALVYATRGQNRALAVTSLPSAQQKAAPHLSRLYQYWPSGKIMFTANQTLLDLRDTERSVALSSQLIVSLDDIACNNNQSECAAFRQEGPSPETSTYDLVFLNTYLTGVSVRSNDNRFTDGLTFTLFSLFSLGFMNTAIGNQATHCLVVVGAPGLEHEAHNSVLFAANCRNEAGRVGNDIGKKAPVTAPD